MPVQMLCRAKTAIAPPKSLNVEKLTSSPPLICRREMLAFIIIVFRQVLVCSEAVFHTWARV